MSRLKELIEKRKEIGRRRLSENRKQNCNNRMEFDRIGNLILEEVYRMYEAGELN